MSFVSVIIPTYNRPDLLVRAVASVLSQTYRDTEVIVVDDFSDPNHRGVLHDAYSSLQNVQVLLNDVNLGPGECRNIGLSRSNGNYILFLDDDDELAPEFLHHAVLGFESNPGVDAIILNSMLHKMSSHKTWKYFTLLEAVNRQVDECTFTKEQLPLFMLSPPAINSFLLKRDLIGTSPFNTQLRYGEDVVLWVKLLLEGATFLKLPSLESASALIRIHRDKNLSTASHSLVIKCFEEMLTLPLDVRSRGIIQFKLIIHLFLNGQLSYSINVLVNGLRNPFSVFQAASDQLGIKTKVLFKYLKHKVTGL